MKYIESFFWGMIVALSALFLEVFLQVILNDVFKFSFFSIHYEELSFSSVLISILIIAVVEESLKLVIFWKRILLFVKSYYEVVFLGFLLGFGFFSFEIILAFYNQSLFLLNFWQILVVFLIHTVLGILALVGLAKFSKNYIIIVLFLISFLHFLGNVAILHFLR